MRTILTCWLIFLSALARARELDPATCASRFDIQKDKIIRTEESREMGARYLSELDVGTRNECLRLCCETEACDVFVYEEKMQGSCYLFSCGPPEDFRCKFTSHGNFSSGVLALSRRLAELQDQERLAQHEHELTNLRLLTTSTPSTTTMRTTTTPRPSPSAELNHRARPSLVTSRRCSRYQFECHTGGECIAVYNACDGIPQCADGSDEGPELGCPPTQTLPTTTTARATPSFRQPPHSELTDVVVPNMNNAPMEGNSIESWPHRLTQAQTQHRYPEPAPSSHIFSHKGGLLQDPERAANSNNIMNQYRPVVDDPWPRRTWPQPQPVEQGMEGGWGGPGGGVQYMEPEPRHSWRMPPQTPQQPELPPYPAQKTMLETPTIYSNQHTLRDSPKKGLDLMKQLPEPPAPKVDPQPEKVPPEPEQQSQKKELKTMALVTAKPKTTSPPPTPVPTTKPIHEHYTSDDDHYEVSEHPPGAVLLLVLGILMTVCMGAIVGCRARAVRRRLHKGKLAHDADYLVNGMYL